jgi:hypothetical protein
MNKIVRPLFTEDTVAQIIDERLKELMGGGPPMNTHFEKYLDNRFAHIEEDMKGIRSDIKDQNSKIDALKYWIMGTAIALAALFFSVIGYHTMVMQSQFQVFSDYVKAVTQPHTPKLPSGQ